MLGALVIGMVLGLVVQRGGFCGAALLSRAVLERDSSGPRAILLSIFVSMLGFAALARFGLIVPNPNPLRLASALVGGLVFGSGMVLAGGCVVGSLYKAGEGRLTSMLALLGIGLGAIAVAGGVLRPVRRFLVMTTQRIKAPAGLDELCGLRYDLSAAILAAIGLLLVFAWSRRRGRGSTPTGGGEPLARRCLTRAWPIEPVGMLVGILGWLAYLSSSASGRNYPLGAVHGVAGAFAQLVGASEPGAAWTMALVAGVPLGAALSARMRGQLALRSADPATLLVALGGGLLVGVGAAIGHGCFIGNTVSGLALLSLHSLVFTAATVAANWVTTVLYLRGLR